MPAHDIMQQSEFVYYECDERGLWLHLGERKHVQFSQTAERPWLAQIRINDNEDGKLIPIEVKWELVRLLEKTRHFQRGMVRYVPSPEEVRSRVKRQDQDKALEQLKEDLKGGLLVLPLNDMNAETVLKLADRIGVLVYSKNGRALGLPALRIAIAGKLGLITSTQETGTQETGDPDKSLGAEDLVVAEVTEPEKESEKEFNLADMISEPKPETKNIFKKRGKK